MGEALWGWPSSDEALIELQARLGREAESAVALHPWSMTVASVIGGCFVAFAFAFAFARGEAGPYFSEGLDLVAEGHTVSRPYLAMTVATMASFGVHVDVEEGQRFRVRPGQRYSGTRFAVEPDASAACNFFAAAAITGGRVRVNGLSRLSIQGDLGFVDVLEQMGAEVRRTDGFVEVVGHPLKGVEVNLADFSDTAPTLAVTAAFASTPTRITGIGFIRHK